MVVDGAVVVAGGAMVVADGVAAGVLGAGISCAPDPQPAGKTADNIKTMISNHFFPYRIILLPPVFKLPRVLLNYCDLFLHIYPPEASLNSQNNTLT